MAQHLKETTVNVRWGPFGQEFTLRPEYTVVGTPLYAERTREIEIARRFQAEHGGTVVMRLVSDEQAVR